jgi:hypothetical protein
MVQDPLYLVRIVVLSAAFPDFCWPTINFDGHGLPISQKTMVRQYQKRPKHSNFIEHNIITNQRLFLDSVQALKKVKY